MTTIRLAAESYLALRRSLGFKLDVPGRLLLQYSSFLDDAGASHITIESALAWATMPADAQPSWYYYRLSSVRGFAAQMHAVDPRHQVPPADLLPRRVLRPMPYLFTEAEVTALMRAAETTLHPRLHAATYSALIGLLAVTGMRPGEAIRLDRDAVDLAAALVTVVHGKYGKSRELALRPGAVQALSSYAALRDRLCPLPRTPSFFVSTAGTRLLPVGVTRVFRALARRVGLRPRSARCRPRPMGLRHSFAVATMVGWYQAGVDVDAHLPLLATWLGHTNPASTYWYLSASPELLALAAQRQQHTAGRLP